MNSQRRKLPPKLAALSVTALAGLCSQVFFVTAVVHEAARVQPLSAASALVMTAAGSGLWLIVAAMDIFMFPTVRMTRFLFSESLPVAAVMTVAQAGFALAFSPTSATSWTSLPLGLLFYWSLVTVCLFGPEHRRQSRQREQEPTPLHR